MMNRTFGGCIDAGSIVLRVTVLTSPDALPLVFFGTRRAQTSRSRVMQTNRVHKQAQRSFPNAYSIETEIYK